jgi:hypothetical protein
MATSRTTYVLMIRHFSIVKLTNSSDDASREDGRAAPAIGLRRRRSIYQGVGDSVECVVAIECGDAKLSRL